MARHGGHTPAIVAFPRKLPKKLSLDDVLGVVDRIAPDKLSEALTSFFLDASIERDRQARATLFLLIAAIASRLSDLQL